MSDELKRILVPPNRRTPIKQNWPEIIQPIVEQMKVMVRFLPTKSCIEVKPSDKTSDRQAISKTCDYLKAIVFGFSHRDAVAILRLEDLTIDSFDMLTVRRLQNEHLSRAIGRVVGEQGKTKNSIENSTKTRIIVEDHKVHILGKYENVTVAKRAICELVMGAPPGKVHGKLKNIVSKLKTN